MITVITGGVSARLMVQWAPMEEQKPMETLDPEDWDRMRELAHRMVDDMLDYIASHRDRPVWTPVPDRVASRLKQPAPRQPEGAEAVYGEFLENVLPYNLHTNHPRFWAWYMGSGTVLGTMAEFLAAGAPDDIAGNAQSHHDDQGADHQREQQHLGVAAVGNHQDDLLDRARRADDGVEAGENGRPQQDAGEQRQVHLPRPQRQDDCRHRGYEREPAVFGHGRPS